MMEYLKIYISQQTINDFQKADVLLNIFFAVVDFLIIVISVLVFSADHKHMLQLCYQLIGIFFVDIIIRLYHIYMLKKEDSNIFLKEIITCLFSTDLFFLLLSLFTETLKALKINEEYNIAYQCSLYILLSFSYENIISYTPITFDRYVLSFSSFILFAQSSFSIVFTYYVYDTLKQGLGYIVSTLYKEQKVVRPIHRFMIGAPFICLMIFIFYFLLKLMFLFFKDPLLILYGSMITDIIKDGAKYFVFVSCIVAICLLNNILSPEVNKKGDFEEIQIINS